MLAFDVAFDGAVTDLVGVGDLVVVEAVVVGLDDAFAQVGVVGTHGAVLTRVNLFASRCRWPTEATTPAARLDAIRRAASSILSGRDRMLALGGDHSVTFPLVQAHASPHGPVTIVHLDAHSDLYDELHGSRLSHACPFARILEHKLATRLVQVGIRTLNAHQRQQAERFGVEIIPMRDFRPDLELHLDGPIYLSLDLDVLDPAFAPGVSHHEPGGMSTRELLSFLHGLRANIIGADLVEYNPVRDPIGTTAMVAAKLVKELLALMLR